MDITKTDIEEFAETGAPEDLKKFTLVAAQILNKTQLRALQRFFSRRYLFTVPEGKNATQAVSGLFMAKPEPEPAPEDDAEADLSNDPDTEELLREARAQIMPPPPPKKPAQDFGFGEKGRVSRSQAEAEFDEIIRRRPQ